MSGGSVTLNTKALQAFKRQLKKAEKSRVEVGIFSENAARDDGESNVEVGAKMEFGSAEDSETSLKQQQARGRGPMMWHGNPARSFLMMPITTELPIVIRSEHAQLEKSFVEDGAPAMLEQVGFMGEAVVQDAFDTQGFGTWPNNSKKTVEWKGSDKPLIDSTQLRKSVSSRVK